MAKLSKKHYEFITEAMAHGLADVQAHDSSMQEHGALIMIRKMADYMEDDSQNFDRALFIENVSNQAKLALMAKNGINLS